MKEIIEFFKDIFMINNDNQKVGLCQFKNNIKVEEPVKKVAKINKEVKLSDLMRRSA